ncbi:MAG: hypothetical protein H6993_17525 [Pseudomonadales bacterium]|nr:hypothetical protein [Pseudomonadales bacterium]MCP5185768.1 hypothetical protein [Pseudomonadales bacterium]
MRVGSMPILLVLAAAVAGCSIARPHPDLVDSLRAVRVWGDVTVTSSERWVLPRLATVTVAHADNRVDDPRLAAAGAGLASYLHVIDATANWCLLVHWPDVAESAAPPVAEGQRSWWQRSLDSGRDAITRAADRGTLLVDVVHRPDAALVTRLEVHIDPWLRGRDWQDETTLRQAFDAVGRTLTGG